MDKELTPSEIIDALGGTSATARLFKVSPAAVTPWRTRGIPEPRLMYLKLLRPDLFGNDRRGKRRTRTT
jgi:hypothetical protein